MTGIERLEVAGLDLSLAGELAAVDNAALEYVPVRHHTAETFLLDCRGEGNDYPVQALWVARRAGSVVGYSALCHNAYQNLDGAKILGAVHPDHQRQGIGGALLRAAEAGTDRPKLRAPAWAHTAGEQAVPAMGYTRTGSHEVRRLALRREQPAVLTERAAQASRDYVLERFTGPCPDDLLADLQVLREAINDAPGVGEFATYPPERIRRLEVWLAGQRQTPYTVIARHRDSGEAAGWTLVVVHDLRPAIAAQEDTSVLAPHRGHRLGLRLKLAMTEWLRDERPDVEVVDTWNDPGNAPMIAINDALGCERVAETVMFRKERRVQPSNAR